MSKACKDCGADISQRGNRSKRCVECQKNRELQLMRDWQRNNHDNLRKYQKEYYQGWRQKNRERESERQQKRYQQLGGHSHRRAWPDLLLRDGPVCGICGEHLDPIHENFHVDHIVPAAHGGTNDLSNLQLAHPACNIRKKDKWDGTEPTEPPAQLGLFD